MLRTPASCQLLVLVIVVVIGAPRAGAAEEDVRTDVVSWPAIGSTFPVDVEATRPTVSPERLGNSVWSDPPAVISPDERSWYDYQSIIWGGRVGPLKGDAQYYHALRSLSIRSSMVYSHYPADCATEAGMAFYNSCLCGQLYLRNKTAGKSKAAFKANRNRESAVRHPSLEEPRVDARERKSVRYGVKHNAQHQPLAYDLRDEASYTTGSASPHDFDFSPVSLASFRKWLQRKYGSLDALNQGWETAYATWDDVYPLMTDEIRDREYRRIARMNLAPWADHREYNDDTFLSAIARYGAEVERHDAGAPWGISGTQMPSAWGGFDYWKMCNTVSWFEYYDVCGSQEIIRSFLPKGYPTLAVVRYKDRDAGLAGMWKNVLHGDAGGLIWPYRGSTSRNVLFDVGKGKIVPTESGRIVGGIFEEARSGIPCLIRRAEVQHDPIGILYSQASIRADWMMEVKTDGKNWYSRFSSYESKNNYAAAGREGMFRLLEDLGLQPTYLASQQVERGELTRRGFKMLIVPRGIALSREEIAKLTEFVSGGGVLVTDLMAGRMDENGRVWPKGPSPIDNLLGVERAPFAFEEQEGSFKGGFGHPIELTFQDDVGSLKAGETVALQGFQEPDLKAQRAKVLATTPSGPALLENVVGKGAVYTLNFDIPNYLTCRVREDVVQATAPYRAILKALVDKAGIRPASRVTRKGSDEHPVGIEVFTYDLGEAQLIAAHVNGSVRIELDLSDSGAGVADVGRGTIVVALPQKGYVTEMRTGTLLGFTDQVEWPIIEERPMVLAVLPYEVEALDVELGEGKIVDDKLPITVRIEAKGSVGDHVVHAELLDAEGKVLPESVVNLPLPNGAYQGAIDFRSVEGEGPWTLRLRDVASGKVWARPVKR